MEARVGEWERGMMRMWQGKGREGYVVEVLRGPLAVVRYVSVAIEVMRWVVRLGLERQKKHSEGPGGGPRFGRLWGRWWWEVELLLLKRE